MRCSGCKPLRRGEPVSRLGDFLLNQVYAGDCLDLTRSLPDDSIDVIVTSPPYWGQRISYGLGVEEDPRAYLQHLQERFVALKRCLKSSGHLWINLADSYNTPVNWRQEDRKYSSLGPQRNGLSERNTAYVKPRHRRKAYQAPEAAWLQYGNLLA